MNRPGRTIMDEDGFKNWKAIYLLVIVYTTALIIGLYFFSRIFG
jgi:hypothetical protein